MKHFIDPEAERWNRKYPHFPSVAKCVELLKTRNVRGTWIDIICEKLEEHAQENAEELITATRFEVAQESNVGHILLSVLSDAKIPAAMPLFAELLDSPDESMRPYGVAGLQFLNTKESRRLLWKHEKRVEVSPSRIIENPQE